MTDFSQVFYPRKQLNRAVITAAGIDYYEWTTVSVRWAVQETPAIRFRFTVSEQTLPDQKWPLLQLSPPDPVTITLDGEQVCDGFITTRQVYYSGTEHQVELQGVCWAGKANLGAASPEEQKKKPVQAIAQKLVAPFGVGVQQLGMVDPTPVERFQAEPGETAWESVERLVRMVGAYLTSDPGRNMILVGQGAKLGAAEFKEGVNILEAREVIHTTMAADKYQWMAQSPGSDQRSMSDAAQQFASVGGKGGALGATIGGMTTRSLAELPAFMLQMLQMRGHHEANTGFWNQIQVECTQVGWQMPGGGIWKPLVETTVNSPMLIMDGFMLKSKAVEFTQDDHGGTRCKVELTNILSGADQWQSPSQVLRTPTEPSTGTTTGAVTQPASGQGASPLGIIQRRLGRR